MKDDAKVLHRMTYFGVKHKTFSDLGGLLNIMQIILKTLSIILWS